MHLTTREGDIAGTVLVNGRRVSISDLELSPVSGTVTNGRGEEHQISAPGIAVREICPGEVIVTASDEYSAVVTEDDEAYLILDGESLRLVVFGDENAKRDVKNVVRIDSK